MKYRWFPCAAVVLALLMMPIGHMAVMLLRLIDDPWLFACANVTVGLLGFAVMWSGVDKPELKASLLGFVAGHLMFVGFFEFGFELAARAFALEPLRNPVTGEVVLAPSLQINEASFFILLLLFLLSYANKQVRCNMIVWLRKVLRMKAGLATEAAKDRSYTTITAGETIFVIWMIYAISLITLDPRILGVSHPVSSLIYCWFLVWPIYLSFRIGKIKPPGLCFRYAIPVGVLFWCWVEMFASVDMLVEFYLQPQRYPWRCLAVVLLAIGLFVLVYRGRLSGSPRCELDASPGA